MTRSICRRLSLLLPLVIAGCSSSSTQPNADAGGQTSDAGQTSNDAGGTTADSGTQNDSGSQNDTGAPIDSGTQEDAGTQSDGAAAMEAGTDPICSNPSATPSTACETCLEGLAATTPCISQFLTVCEGDPDCVNFYQCGGACARGTATTDAGGGEYCLSMEADAGQDDSGAITEDCASCCETQTPAGRSAYLGDLVKTCVCASSAPCAAACAM